MSGFWYACLLVTDPLAVNGKSQRFRRVCLQKKMWPCLQLMLTYKTCVFVTEERFHSYYYYFFLNRFKYGGKSQVFIDFATFHLNQLECIHWRHWRIFANAKTVCWMLLDTHQSLKKKTEKQRCSWRKCNKYRSLRLVA